MSTRPYLQTSHHYDVGSKHSFSKYDLEQCAEGLMFGAGNAQLPLNPLLMLGRVTDIRNSGGDFERGFALAELDVSPSDWYFDSHFKDDPIMPGCLLIESMWQLTGFHLAWLGYSGKARVLEGGRTRFHDVVTGECQTLTISIHVRKTFALGNPICIADGLIENETTVKCRSSSIKNGLF